MSSRARIRIAFPLAAALFPALAHAQEPQPWTNTSGYGSRVSPALPVARDHSIVLRADGGGGSTKTFRLSETRGAPPDGPKTSATFLAGRSGASYGYGPWEAFATSAAYRVTIPKLKRDSANGPLAVNPYTQSGDAAFGARWTTAINRDMSAGVEGGAVILGATGAPGETGLALAGPALSATSPFARGLFTWQGMRPARGEEGALTASVNLGVFSDQSWKVWERATEEANRTDATKEPLPEERIAMGFYGDTGPETRILFGAGVSYDVTRLVRPFAEVSGESTSTDRTMRVTPGIAIRPTPAVSLFLSADFDMSGEPEVSPMAPAFRANAGLALAFGAREPRRDPGPGPRATPRPSSTPIPARRFPMSFRVVDESGKPIPSAAVRVFRAGQPSGPGLPPVADGNSIGDGTTGSQGTVTISLPDDVRTASASSLLLVTAKHPQYMEWLPASVSPKTNPPPAIILYSQRVPIALQISSCVAGWNPPPGVRVMLQPLPTGAAAPRGKRIFSGTERIEVPVNNDGFRRWNVRVDMPDFGSTEYSIDDLTPAIRLYVDPEKKCLDFQQAKCACAAAPVATPVAAEKTLFGIFEGDSVDVKQEEAAKLYARLLPIIGKQPHKVIVQAKKGDPLFQSALAAARRDALSAWLNTKGIPAGTVNYAMDSEAKTDHVILEVSK